MHLIDTHAHLVMGDYRGQVAEVLERSRQAGIDRWITIGTDLKDSEAGVLLSMDHAGVFCTVGVHPHEAKGVTDDYIAQMEELAESAMGIGEIGLDYHYDNSPRKQQKKVFAEQLELALKLDKTIVIHCREALEDCLRIMDEGGARDAQVVFHCFTGNRAEARRLLDWGYYVSFTGVITYKNAQVSQKTAQYVRADRILLETDCPFLTPEPRRKIRRNEPSFMIHTAQKLAELRGMDIEEVAHITTENAERLFLLEEK